MRSRERRAKKKDTALVALSVIILALGFCVGVVLDQPAVFVAGAGLFTILLCIGAGIIGADAKKRRAEKREESKPDSSGSRQKMPPSNVRHRYDGGPSGSGNRQKALPSNPVGAVSLRRNYSFRVAGIGYREGALRAVAIPNPEYSFAGTPDGWRIYQYARTLPPVALIPDPGNEHDPHAIAVYIRGYHIGFVPADETSIVHEILAHGGYTATAQLSGGPWIAWRGGELVIGEHGMTVRISLDY